jgi:transcriptional regulator GlxA family with amidase domain
MAAGTAVSPVSVRLLAVPDSSASVLFGLYEVLRSVGTMWSHLTGEAPAGPTVDVRIVARSSDALSSSIGVPIVPHAAIAADDTPHVVIVNDVTLPLDVDPRGCWPEETAWLRHQFARGAVVCSVCTGTLLLAEAGLLDDEEATTHWSATELFRRCYPSIRLRPERVMLPAGEGHRLVTSGGAASWEDLALYLIARFCGTAEAVRAAKIFVIGDRGEGQLPFAAAMPRRHQDAVITRCQSWIAEHFANPAPVAGMVARSGLPERTFKRRFVAATGCNPLGYVHMLRIQAARQRLESSPEGTDDVAAAVGYEDPAFFRRLFKRHTGVSPARYRTRFQAVTGSGFTRFRASSARSGSRSRATQSRES